MSKETLGDLIKGYEANYNFTLPKRCPIIVRLDMRAGHTLTHGFDKPYDEVFIKTMQETMLYLCKEISGCQFGYVESDEISLLIYETNPEAEPWFANRLQKICSVSASMATLQFNRKLKENVENWLNSFVECSTKQWLSTPPTERNESDYKFGKNEKLFAAYDKAITDGGMFDSRVFIIPESVIHPYFIWRQNDCTRNSILGLSQKYFSHKEMQNLKCNDLQNKLLTEKDVNWNNESVVHKRGTCAYRVPGEGESRPWYLDTEMPILMDDRNFVKDKIYYPVED